MNIKTPMNQRCRELIRGYEGAFLTMMIGNAAEFVLHNSEEADMLVDLLAEHNPPEFIRLVGQFLHDEVEVA